MIELKINRQVLGAAGSLLGLLLPFLAGFAAARASDCSVTSVGLTPINDLGKNLYLGQFQGGLYPNGSNDVPPAHAAAGMMRAQAIEALDTAGNPDPAGKYVLLSIGMSNTTQEFCSRSSNLPCDPWTFMGQAADHADVNHATLVIVNGARGGQSSSSWDSPNDPNYDRIRDTRLAAQGLSEAQVQAVWVKTANPRPTVSLPDPNADAYTLVRQMGDLTRALKGRYPNVKLVFFSSRIYAGYASSPLNPEPYSYESGFAVKWLIEAQINQMAGGQIDPRAGDLDTDTGTPWIGWGPYPWADGLVSRSDHLTWDCSDLENDGTHPSTSGEQKVGTMLLDFMLNSPFTAPWFRSGSHPVHNDGVFFFPQVVDGISSGMSYQSSLILVNTESDSNVRVNFFQTPDGKPMEVTLGELGSGSSFQFELKRGNSISLQTPGSGDLRVGYARVTAGAGVSGVLIFTQSDQTTGVTLVEAGVPATTALANFSLFVDSLAEKDTGLALVYPPQGTGPSPSRAVEAHITLRLYDNSFNLIAERVMEPMAAGSHLARFIHQFFDEPQVQAVAGELQGLLTVESDQPLAAVTLRLRDDPFREFPQEVPTLTAFPVLPGRAEAGSVETVVDPTVLFYFPQTADGIDGDIVFQTTLILTNTGADTAVKVEFFDSMGAPLAMTLGELGTDSTFEFALKRGESFSAQTPGTGPLQVGYARITAAPGLGGTAIFTRSDRASGTVLYEAGVPASTPLSDFSLFVDSLDDKDTGLALVNPPAGGPAQQGQATATLRLYDKSFELIDTVKLVLAEGEHLPRFVFQLFPQAAQQAQEMEGILTVESDRPLVAVTLRQNDNPKLGFPQKVPTLAPFPVIPEDPAAGVQSAHRRIPAFRP